MLGGDIRPAHFLGVHARQIIYLAGLVLQRSLGNYAGTALMLFTAVYLVAWVFLATLGLRSV